ncbi:MAG: heavy-metal-associated domain-containing protein [Calditrichia bacterium]
MFTIKVIAGLFLMLLPMALFAGGEGEVKSDANKKDQVEKVSYSVEGMSCSGCSINIEGTMSKVDGVIRCNVDLRKGKANIEYDPTKVNKKQIEEKMKSTGFAVAEIEKKEKTNEKEKTPQQKEEDKAKSE